MLLKTDSHSREIIKKEVQQNNIQDYIHYIIFTDNGRTIFEGYDGLEYGIFSNSFIFHIGLPSGMNKKIYMEFLQCGKCSAIIL